jgi:hypothetical protein
MIKKASAGTASHGSMTTTCFSLRRKKAATAKAMARITTNMMPVLFRTNIPVAI